MNRHIPSVGRYLSILAVCLLALLGSATVVQAQTSTDISQFDVVSASTSTSRWTTRGCTDDDDIDDGCYVRVRADNDLRDDIENENAGSAAENWASYFNDECDDLRNGDSYAEKNEDFNDCWEDAGATVTWPQVDPSENFEATGFCKSGDTTCSIGLNICYNADECDGRRSNDDEFEEDDGRMADFFDDTRRCLFDVRARELTECINEELRDVYDALQRQNRVGYDALEERLEEQGVEIESYSTSLRRVEDTSFFGREYLETQPRTPYVPPVSQPGVSSAPYRPGLTRTSKTWINQGVWPAISGYSPVQSSDFILVPFTQYLEAQPYTRICGTNVGCIDIVGGSSHFAYMGNISIVNSDWNTISCLRGRGYRIGRGTILAFNDPNLQACDNRMAAANSYCPDGGEGAKAELLKMYNLGLVPNLLTLPMAQGLQNDLTRASTTAPGCLCNAGFASSDLVVSTSSTENPWAAGASISYSNICG